MKTANVRSSQHAPQQAVAQARQPARIKAFEKKRAQLQRQDEGLAAERKKLWGHRASVFYHMIDPTKSLDTKTMRPAYQIPATATRAKYDALKKELTGIDKELTRIDRARERLKEALAGVELRLGGLTPRANTVTVAETDRQRMREIGAENMRVLERLRRPGIREAEYQTQRIFSDAERQRIAGEQRESFARTAISSGPGNAWLESELVEARTMQRNGSAITKQMMQSHPDTQFFPLWPQA